MSSSLIITPELIEVVIYRSSCSSGFAAAWAAWKVLNNAARYWSARPNTRAPLEWSQSKVVALLDFCYPPDELKKLVAVAKHVLVIDHHQQTERLLEDPSFAGKVTRIFDPEQSGAILTWSFFHPQSRIPRFLEYIEDREFYHWKLPDSRDFSEALNIEPMEFHAYNRFYLGDDLEAEQRVIQTMIERGKVIVDYVKFNISRMSVRAHVVNWCGYWVKVLNSASWMSEIGHHLATSPDHDGRMNSQEPPIDFAVVWNYDHRKESINCSLRTDRPGLDLSIIAKHYGGGGHAAAAGFAFQGSIKKLFKTSFVSPPPQSSGRMGIYRGQGPHHQSHGGASMSRRAPAMSTSMHQMSYGAHPQL